MKLNYTADSFSRAGKVISEDIKSEYKHVEVYQMHEKGNIVFRSVLKGVGEYGSWAAFFTTDREAAKAVDRQLAEIGREPINGTLKRV